jgi:presenilin-like A22 family membrane protease
MIQTSSAQSERDRAYGLGFLAGALASAVPSVWIILRASREGAFLLLPFVEAARPIFYVFFVALALGVCYSAWRQRADAALLVLGTLTGIVLAVTLVAPVWWDPNAFFDRFLSIPMVAFGTYAVFAIALSLEWFLHRRARSPSAA